MQFRGTIKYARHCETFTKKTAFLVVTTEHFPGIRHQRHLRGEGRESEVASQLPVRAAWRPSFGLHEFDLAVHETLQPRLFAQALEVIGDDQAVPTAAEIYGSGMSVDPED